MAKHDLYCHVVMAASATLLTLLFLTSLAGKGAAWRDPSPPKYVEMYYEQQVDHFNYEVKDTFMERYLLSGELGAIVTCS